MQSVGEARRHVERETWPEEHVVCGSIRKLLGQTEIIRIWELEDWSPGGSHGGKLAAKGSRKTFCVARSRWWFHGHSSRFVHAEAHA